MGVKFGLLHEERNRQNVPENGTEENIWMTKARRIIWARTVLRRIFG
jgi:hypothetical protein